MVVTIGTDLEKKKNHYFRSYIYICIVCLMVNDAYDITASVNSCPFSAMHYKWYSRKVD